MAGWWAIVPVRSGPSAKSRLSELPADLRAGLSLAFARDTVAAARACEDIDTIIVVGDPAALEAFGDDAITTPDPGQGLNAAIETAAGQVPRANPVAVILGDLPALTPEELRIALQEGATSPRSFVCDAEGVGTTLLMSLDGSRLRPCFGERSRAAHAASGAVEIDAVGLERLRRDVDTTVALWDAVRLGVGPATRQALA